MATMLLDRLRVCQIVMILLTAEWCFAQQTLLTSGSGSQNPTGSLHSTLLRSMRNQASLLSRMNMGGSSNPALDMLISSLGGQNPATSMPSMQRGSSLWTNMLPMDQLLQQHRDMQSSLLRNVMDTSRRAQGGTGSAQPQTDSNIAGASGSQPQFDNVRVVIFNNRPGTNAGSTLNQAGPEPTVQTGFTSSFSSGPTSSHFFENLVSGFHSTGQTSVPAITQDTSGLANIQSQPSSEVVLQENPNVVLASPSPTPPIGPTKIEQPPTAMSTSMRPALTCTGDFRAIPGHTLCMDDNPGMTYSGVSVDDKLLITQYHNELRGGVQPPATDLLKLHWDDRLAAVAEKWAKQCVLAHDKERSIPELGLSVGQNVAVGYDNWQTAIKQWYDEIRMYRYGFDPDSYLGPEGWRDIAHFTQMVQNGTYLIGCGYAECPYTEYIRFYVCNYAAGQSDLAYPYTAGTRCESCPNNCVNGLCDCGNLACRNKGVLNPSTCTCECPRPFKGKSCEIVDCPAKDNWICGRDWPASYCDRYFNVPEECPHMCGLCGGGGVKPAVEQLIPDTPIVVNITSTTHTSSFGCQYTGKRDNQQTCKQYGDKGADMRMCASEGGNVGCSECDRYFNIKKDYCPVMCGLCDPPCNGKKCLNGGTLETASCVCTCRPPFTGDICQLAQCPSNGDPQFCEYWPRRYCDMYHNVPEECPYKCGICTDRTNPAMMANTELELATILLLSNENLVTAA